MGCTLLQELPILSCESRFMMKFDMICYKTLVMMIMMLMMMMMMMMMMIMSFSSTSSVESSLVIKTVLLLLTAGQTSNFYNLLLTWSSSLYLYKLTQLQYQGLDPKWIVDIGLLSLSNQKLTSICPSPASFR